MEMIKMTRWTGLMGGQCYLAPRFKALNSCQLDRDLGLMRMTALAGQVRPCDRARGTRSVGWQVRW